FAENRGHRLRQRLHLRAECDRKMRVPCGINFKKYSNGVRAFLILADILEIESFSRLRLLPLRLLRISDQILPLLLFRKELDKSDDHVPFVGMLLHELASFDWRPHLIAPLRP